jgi:hypothetical protein
MPYMTQTDLIMARGELDDLLALDEGLTGWEVEFIESLSRRLADAPLSLTDGQARKLHQIWERECC